MAYICANGHWVNSNICMSAYTASDKKHINYYSKSSCKAIQWPSQSSDYYRVYTSNDLGKKLSQSITVYVYNAKTATQAKLDYIKINCLSSINGASTQVGSLTIGNIGKNSTSTFTVSYTLPTNITSDKKSIVVICGDTNSKQKWETKTNLTTYSTYTSSGTSARVSAYAQPTGTTENCFLGGISPKIITSVYFKIS